MAFIYLVIDGCLGRETAINLRKCLDGTRLVSLKSQFVFSCLDWYDQFLDWDPREYEMINKTILPYNEVWIPDTILYNSESLEQRRTEALMNVIITTG